MCKAKGLRNRLRCPRLSGGMILNSTHCKVPARVTCAHLTGTPDDGNSRQINDNDIYDQRAIAQNAPGDDHIQAHHKCSMPASGQLCLQGGLPCTAKSTGSLHNKDGCQPAAQHATAACRLA